MKEDIKFWFKNHNYQWKYKLVVCLPLFLVLIAIDWITKGVVSATMSQEETKGIIPGVIEAHYIINTGSAYGFNAQNVGLSIGLATAITFVTAVIITFVNDKMWLIPIVFIFSGSFANLLGRAWSPATNPGNVHGGVIDFLHWEFNWLGQSDYIFNMADAWVTIGVIILIICLIIEIIKAIVVAVKKHKNNEVELYTIESKNDADIKTINKSEAKPRKTTKIDPSKLNKKELKAYNKLNKKKKAK